MMHCSYAVIPDVLNKLHSFRNYVAQNQYKRELAYIELLLCCNFTASCVVKCSFSVDRSVCSLDCLYLYHYSTLRVNTYYPRRLLISLCLTPALIFRCSKRSHLSHSLFSLFFRFSFRPSDHFYFLSHFLHSTF